MADMRKGPLLASIILIIIGLGLVITGAITYTNQGDWSDWTLWFGLIGFNIGLVILVTAFIRKPGDVTEDESTADTSS